MTDFAMMLDSPGKSGYETGNIFSYEYVIPCAYAGFIIRLLCRPGFLQWILELFLKDGKINHGRSMVYCEGWYGSERAYFMTAFDCNIKKLQRFKEGMAGHPDDKFAIACFRWQAQMIYDYLGHNVQIICLGMDRMTQELDEWEVQNV